MKDTILFLMALCFATISVAQSEVTLKEEWL
jgi:hypothetical protein